MGNYIFNADLSKWDVSKAGDMRNMFYVASSFNGNLSKWDVSKVSNMSSMFEAASKFNGDISKWDVSNVLDMRYMFSACFDFHGDLSKWDVSKVNLSKGHAHDMFAGDDCSLCDKVPVALNVTCHVDCKWPLVEAEHLLSLPL